MNFFTFNNNKIVRYNNKILARSSGTTPYSMILEYADGVMIEPWHYYDRSNHIDKIFGTVVQISSSPNIWKWIYNDPIWSSYTGIVDSVLPVYEGNGPISQPTRPKIKKVHAINSTGVTYMHSLFKGQTDITELPWFDTSEVTNTEAIFSGCTSLTTIPAIDTSKVTDSDFMFSGCTALTSLPNLILTNDESTSYMFLNCTALTNMQSLNLPNVKWMSQMFNGCTNLATIGTITTSNKLTSTVSMFEDCSSLTSVNPFDISGITNSNFGGGAYRMFKNCSSLTTCPAFNTVNLRGMEEMYKGCTSITAVPLYDTTNALYMSYMFQDCVNVQSGAYNLYNQAKDNANLRAYLCFDNCGTNTTSGTAELAQIPEYWGGTAT